jgi:hypothetical protein
MLCTNGASAGKVKFENELGYDVRIKACVSLSPYKKNWANAISYAKYEETLVDQILLANSSSFSFYDYLQPNGTKAFVETYKKMGCDACSPRLKIDLWDPTSGLYVGWIGWADESLPDFLKRMEGPVVLKPADLHPASLVKPKESKSDGDCSLL